MNLEQNLANNKPWISKSCYYIANFSITSVDKFAFGLKPFLIDTDVYFSSRFASFNLLENFIDNKIKSICSA